MSNCNVIERKKIFLLSLCDSGITKEYFRNVVHNKREPVLCVIDGTPYLCLKSQLKCRKLEIYLVTKMVHKTLRKALMHT